MTPPRRIVTLTGALVALALLAGCASVGDQLDSAIQATNSAVQSAKLAVTLHIDTRATSAVTATTLSDALTELLREESTVSQLSAASNSGSNDTAASDRQATLKLIRQATDAVTAASDALSAGEELGSAEAGLASVAKKVGAAARQTQERSKKSP
jgi:hypothetical protein